MQLPGNYELVFLLTPSPCCPPSLTSTLKFSSGAKGRSYGGYPGFIEVRHMAFCLLSHIICLYFFFISYLMFSSCRCAFKVTCGGSKQMGLIIFSFFLHSLNILLIHLFLTSFFLLCHGGCACGCLGKVCGRKGQVTFRLHLW